MQQHVYTSSKGETFLSWDEWARTTLSEADLQIYMEPFPEGDPMPAEKLALYSRWIQEEKIISHVVMENGVVIVEHDI
jgi:hypothetical protein